MVSTSPASTPVSSDEFRFTSQNLRWWGLVLSVLFLIVLLSTEFVINKEADKALLSVAHTHEVNSALIHVLSDLQDAETGQRGFLLTGQKTYLAPYNTAINNLETNISLARQLTADNPRQQRRLDHVEFLAASKLRELNETITLWNDHMAAEAIKVVESGRGKIVMDQLRAAVAEMEAEENALLLERKQRAETTRQIGTAIEAATLSMLFLIGLYIFVKMETQSKALKGALEQEQKYSALQQQFVSLVSHEFRTPLAIIDSSAQRIERTKDKITSDQLMERSLNIRRAVERMTKLIDLTLYSDRIDSGNVEMLVQPCKIKDMIEKICEYHREASPHHDIRVNIDGIPESIDADPKLLEHTFTNLLSNAIKYAPDSPLIEVFGHVKDDMALVRIKDQGLGIAKDDLSHMFERFFRAKTATGIRGTGIGLSLCKQFIEMHGGTIGVASVEGEGSTFTVQLPIGGIDA